MKPREPAPILCGTDFSENAGHAATAAAALAVRAERPLLLVHVADEYNARGNDQRELAAFLRPAAKQLRGEAYRLRQAGATVATKILTAQVAEQALMKFSEKLGAPLVVVSSESKNAFDRLMLGSVSEHLAQADPVPTLVVRSAAPFEAWARGERPLRIFMAADLAPVTEAALQWVRDLRRQGPCEVVVAYVNRPAEECQRLGLSKEILENPPEVQRLLERDLREKVSVWLGEEQVRIVVEALADRPEQRLIALAVEAEADLIVVGTHQRQGLARMGHASVSRGILRHAPMSVACVAGVALDEERKRLPVIRRVLVATDFSELGNRAVPYAYAVLGEGGSVFLLHIAPSPSSPNPLATDAGARIDDPKEAHALAMREASEALKALIPAEAEERGVRSKAEVVGPSSAPPGLPRVGPYFGIVGEAHVIESADPARAICEAAERFGADVICLGSHGRSGLSAALLGSVAQAVMAQSPRPVLVVRPPAQ